MENQLIGKELKFAVHIPANDEREDTHYIKEVLHYKDGSKKHNVRLLTNYKRPFYITKKHYQNHKDKKETEDLDKVTKFYSTESDLYKSVATRLGGRYNGLKNLRVIKDSPYVYGMDINSTVNIKYEYTSKYGELLSNNSICTIDVETNIYTNKIIICSIAMVDKIYTAIDRSYLGDIHDPIPQLHYLYKKHIPQTELLKDIKIEYEIVDNDLAIVNKVFEKAHQWQPDIMSAWNMEMELTSFLDTLENYDIDPKDVFSDPNIPKELRYLKIRFDSDAKTTASGKFKPKQPEMKWHTVYCPSSFYWIDAMSAHRYVRAGGKNVPGGYGLNNMLTTTLGKDFGKLKFDDMDSFIGGIDWHIFMQANKKLEYIIYNQWDVLSMLVLDNKTQDMEFTMPTLLGGSTYDTFNSGPKTLVNNMNFFFLERNRVLGTKGASAVEVASLGLDNWIVILSPNSITNNGLCIVDAISTLFTNMRGHIFDADQVSGYPSDTMAANVSLDTTRREILSIGTIDKDEFKTQNINLVYGNINAIEYCTIMHELPEMRDMLTMASKYV